MNRYILKNMEKKSLYASIKNVQKMAQLKECYSYLTLQNHFELLFSVKNTLVHGPHCKHTYKIFCIKVTFVEGH